MCFPMAKKKKAPAASKPKKAAAATANKPSRKKYQSNFLSKVIARVDFSPALEISESEPPQIFPKLRARFPSSELQVSAHQKIELSDTGNESGTKFSVERKHHWQFHGKNRDRYLEVTQNAVLVNYEAYESFERLRDDFLPMVDHILGDVDGLRIHRLGLRYVDSIELKESKPTEWQSYLKGDLLTSFNLADDAKTISRAFNVIEFNYGDDMQLRFQYGMPNPDFPAPIKKKLFILDWDAYAAGVSLGLHDIENYLEHFHEKINSSFEEVITDNLRKKMGVTNG